MCGPCIAAIAGSDFVSGDRYYRDGTMKDPRVSASLDIKIFGLYNSSTVDSRYLEIEGTLENTSRYPYFDISDL